MRIACHLLNLHISTYPSLAGLQKKVKKDEKSPEGKSPEGKKKKTGIWKKKCRLGTMQKINRKNGVQVSSYLVLIGIYKKIVSYLYKKALMKNFYWRKVLFEKKKLLKEKLINLLIVCRRKNID